MNWKFASSFFFAAAVLAVAAGCNIQNNSEEFSYEFDVNGCSTGKHTFNSRDAYCKALADEALNNGCAYSLRKQTFEANCPGYTWPDASFYDELY